MPMEMLRNTHCFQKWLDLDLNMLRLKHHLRSGMMVCLSSKLKIWRQENDYKREESLFYLMISWLHSNSLSKIRIRRHKQNSKRINEKTDLPQIILDWWIEYQGVHPAKIETPGSFFLTNYKTLFLVKSHKNFKNKWIPEVQREKKSNEIGIILANQMDISCCEVVRDRWPLGNADMGGFHWCYRKQQFLPYPSRRKKHAHFISTYSKIRATQRLAWPLLKHDIKKHQVPNHINIGTSTL